MIPVVNKKKRVPDVVQEVEPLNPYDSMIWSNPATGRVSVFHEKRNRWLRASYPKAVDPFGVGYILTGYQYINSTNTRVSTVDIYKFATDTQLTTHSTCNTCRVGGNAVSSTRYGFSLTWDDPYKIAFSSTSFSPIFLSLSGYNTLSVYDNTGSLNSSQHGYRCGGYRSISGSAYSVTTITELKFSDETVVEDQHNLLNDTARCGGVSSTLTGYIFGGNPHTPTSSYISTLQTVNFAAMSSWTNDLTLSGEAMHADGGAASTLKGYCFYGYGSSRTTIDSISFSSHTSAVAVSTSSCVRTYSGAMSSTAKGYCCMGYEPGATSGDPGSREDPWKTVDAIYFSNDATAATVAATSDSLGRYVVNTPDTASPFHKHNFQLI